MSEAPDPSSEFPFLFDHVRVSSPKRSCGALLMTPSRPTMFGAARRAAVQDAASLSPVEHRILDYVEARPENTPILILRGGDDEGNRLWSFDPNFDDQELEDTGAVFSRSVMPLYRRLVARGIVLFVHSDWGHREIGPIRRGLTNLAEDLRKTQRDPVMSALDEWIIRNVLLYSSLSLGHVLDQLLPAHLSLLERREQRVARMVQMLPPGSLD